MVTEAVVAENASVDFYIIQDQNEQTVNVTNTLAHQSRDSRFATHTFTLGGKMVRNNLHFTLADENCEAYMNGLYLPSGNQHFDNQSFVDHAMPNCYSNELYKGIMMDQSTGVFNGKIMVREDAQKTNAFQSNKNILLSDDAVINTKPQLEIFADDVKCSHGATIGQLDEEALFYLRARGMGKEQAKAILTEAFAGEVLDSIEIESLKNLLEERVSQKLKQSTI